MFVTTYFLVVLYLLCNLNVIHGLRKVLHIGALLELSDNFYEDKVNLFPDIFEYAFEGIYNRTDILPDYEFRLVVKDTQGKPGLAATKLLELLEEEPPKVAIIGPTFSESLTVTGQIVPFFNIIELSYIAITATTADRNLFSTLYKVNQVTDALNPLRIKMMKYFGWTRVGTIAFQEEFSISQIDHFHGLLRDSNMTLVTSAVISDTSNVRDVLKGFKQFGVRIIIGAFRANVAAIIFCEAYLQGMFGSSYVWILTGPTMFEGWIDNADVDTMECTRNELIEAAHGYFTLDHLRQSESSDEIVSMKTPEEVMYDMLSVASKSKYSLSGFSSWIYDTPWALAIGLNNSLKYLEESGLKLENYNYSGAYVNAVKKGMKEVKFQGVSGPVAFDEKGSRIGINFIQQNFYGVKINVASYDGITDKLTWFVDSSSLWSGNEVPQDRFTYSDVIVSPSNTAFGLIVTLDCGGCVLSFMFLFFNIYFRHNRYIKMSSPMVNNVIIAGCLLMYVEIFVCAIDYRSSYYPSGNNLCMVRIWLLSLAFTSMFGAMFSKTYRVYVVFRDHKLKAKHIKDFHLFGLIGFMLVIDFIILIPWTIVFPLEKQKMSKRTMDIVTSNKIYIESYFHCYNTYSGYWLAAMYVYKGLLLVFGTFLSWETRHVTVPALNDSKYIAACIYNVVVACIFGVPLSHMLPVEQMTMSFVMESSLLLFCTVGTQCIIFMPKIKMRHQVQGQFLTSQVPTEATISTVRQTGINVVVPDVERDKEGQFEDLKEENLNLRMAAANEAIAIARLRKSLLKETGNIHFYKCGPEYVIFKRTGPVASGRILFNDGGNKETSM